MKKEIILKLLTTSMVGVVTINALTITRVHAVTDINSSVNNLQSNIVDEFEITSKHLNGEESKPEPINVITNINGEEKSSEAIKISRFDYYGDKNLPKYDEVFKIDSSNIKSIKNNGGQYGSSNITKAIDGDMSTHWETGTPNSNSFKNEVIVEFNNLTEIDRIVYATRQDSAKGKGFPLEFEVYESISESGDDFTIVGNGKHSSSTGDIMEFKFNKSEVKRLKFKFINSYQDWSSAAEFWFYAEDKLKNTMVDLFTDETCTKLSDNYNDINIINELEGLLQNHPMKDYFIDKIEIAKILVNNNNVMPNSNIVIKKFALKDYKELPEYNEVYKKKVQSISNNGGQYGSNSIGKAIDGDINTFWETGNPNSDTFKNDVVVTFDKIENIDRIVYATRQDGASGKGFPLEFEIYSSLTDVGDNFRLVGNGSYTKANGDFMEFNLDKETSFKRLKIRFINCNENWASASELWFYGEDLLVDKVNNIFANGIYTELKDEYKDINKLNELKEEVKDHPLNIRLMELIEMAEAIVNGENVINGIIIKPTQYGDITKYTREEQLHGMSTNIQPTGLYGIPGERIRVFVDVKDGEPLPKIVFTQIEGHYGNWNREYILEQGLNEILVPEIYDDSWTIKNKKGGPIYILNPYTPEEQSKIPDIRIEGGEKYPIYYDNGDEEEFLNFLQDYKVKLDNDSTDGKVLDLVEIVTESVILTGTTTGAYDAYFTRGIKPEKTTDFWVDAMNEVFRFYGMDGSSVLNKKDNIRESIRLMQPFGYMYAAGGHIGVQGDVMTKMLVPDDIKKDSWGFFHEIGHKLDQEIRTWGEVTNNMLSNHMQQYFNGTSADRVPYSNLVYPKVVRDDIEPIDFNEGDFFERLGMFWQLQMINDDYWTNIQKLYRERKPEIDNERLKRDTFIEYTCELLNMDLTEFFTRHGFAPSSEVREGLRVYEDTGKKYWYLNSSARYYIGEGIDNSRVSINDISIIKNGNDASIKFEVTSDVSSDDILGYEIIKNGKKVAFINEPFYTDYDVNTGETYSYEVVAYGKDLSKSNISDSVSKNTNDPILYIDRGITLVVNSEFNPLDNIKAVDKNGNDITSNIEIISNNVNTNVIGEYKVVYSITDSDKNSTKKEFSVNVINGFDYASDLDWQSAESGWGTIKKDKSIDNRSITLNKYGTDVTYEKGIGTHSNSVIVYDISGKNYDFFQSYVGVDREVVGSPASVTFEVWVDGIKKYDSGKMIADSSAEYVNVPIKGASEVKLIVTDAGNGNGSDHADWADAKLSY